MDYATYYGTIANLAAAISPDTNFDQILPEAITYSELRIQRDLNLLSTVNTDYSVVTSSGTRTATAPNTFVVVQQVNVLSPAGSTSLNGSRVLLTPVSLEAVNAFWPSAATTGTPEMFAMQDQWTIVLGPSPDNTYTLEIVGTKRFTELSALNTTNFLSLYLPDLYIAASMVFISGYQRDFSPAGTDPQMPVNWEQQYGVLLASAKLEEAEKRGWGAAWTHYRAYGTAAPDRN